MGDFEFNPFLFGDFSEGGGETEEDRLRRLAMQQELNASPEQPIPEVQALDETEPPQPRVLMAPRIAGEETQPTAEIMKQYQQWLAERPVRDEYKAGTGRKIAAGLVGFLAGLRGGPETAMRVSHGIADRPYSEAVEDWQMRGKSIGDVGKLAQDVSETGRKRASDVMSFMTSEERVKAANAAITQRENAEKSRHEDRMASIKNESERGAEVKRHNTEMEKIAGQRNTIDRTLAGARTTTANAYAQRVKDLGEGKGKDQKIGSYTDMTEALQDSLQEMEALYPEFKTYFDSKESPSTGLKTFVPKTLTNPADQARQTGMLEDAKKRARKKLEGLWGGLGGVEDIPGMRSEVP